ncbi:AAA family ATPase [Hydrogenophaga sp.]|uniref:ATP-binding protein n=1 Tax=Hydrogenophaga sp. TaxID=1904254 RepID=UPI0027261DC3|nr:AAA family ATPase [Hydrogenophaga sp.]MDO9436656.1 AAA family ATPase [Hydrogenophaga sp.]
MSPPTRVQRPPAEALYAEELAQLTRDDQGPVPPGWRLSMKAVLRFIGGGHGIQRKIVCAPSLLERSLVTLASQRALLLVGEPGTAKSLLSELLAAAVCGTSTLTIQGSAATTEDQIKYGWNYALLLNEGPSQRALVPSPLYRALREGKIVRFEELTRCPPEVQDGLLSILSEKLLMVPELADDNAVFAAPGFNLIATANTRDRGVNDMSAALKRRFAFETVFPIADYDEELALVRAELVRLLAHDQLAVTPADDVLEVLVTTFRELRTGTDKEGHAGERLSTAVSTAEAVSVAHAVTLRGHYLRGDAGQPADIVEALAGAAAKDNADDLKKIRRYIEQRASRRKGDHWQAFHAARHLLPE